MAKLTPAAKVLFGAVILGAAGSASWYLWNTYGSSSFDDATAEATDGTDGDSKAPTTASGSLFSKNNGPVGTNENPLKVSLVSFHGYAPALLANGNSLKTQPGSLYGNLGVNVEFVIQDDIPTLPTIFESGAAHCSWRTSDFWAQEQPNLVKAGLNAKAVMVVDNTQGADAIIARDSSIQSVEDLAGKKVALLQFTPSHGMLINALDNSSLSRRKKDSVTMVFVNADEGTAGVRAAFTAGHVDAAVLWDPDLSLAVKSTPGAHVVYSTKTATNLIYDVIVCDQRVLDDPSNKANIQKFVKGWMMGVQKAEEDKGQAIEALLQTEPFFVQLAKQEGKPFVRSLFDNLVWTGLEDNVRILGMAGNTNHYERVYGQFDEVYRVAQVTDNSLPKIAPTNSFDYSYIKSLMDTTPAAKEAATVPEFKFNSNEREKVAKKTAALTKPVDVHFKTGVHSLTKRALKTIDDQMVPIIENNGSAYILISGNTDSTGSRGINMRLSQQRAQAVADYLVKEWEFPRDRFKVVGNGPDKPICDEKNPDADGFSLDECRAQNRTTRVAILSR